MYLYHKWEKYKCVPMHDGDKRLAVMQILSAMNKMELTLEQVTQLIPMPFLKEHKVMPTPVLKDTWGHLNSIIYCQSRYGSKMVTKFPKSIAIFREAFHFLENVEWYYVEWSYWNLISEALWLNMPQQNNEIIFVPDIFGNVNRYSMITEEEVTAIPEIVK